MISLLMLFKLSVSFFSKSAIAMYIASIRWLNSYLALAMYNSSAFTPKSTSYIKTYVARELACEH